MKDKLIELIESINDEKIIKFLYELVMNFKTKWFC